MYLEGFKCLSCLSQIGPINAACISVLSLSCCFRWIPRGRLSLIHQPSLALPHRPKTFLTSIWLLGPLYNQTVVTSSGLPASLTYQPFAANFTFCEIFSSWNAPITLVVLIVIGGHNILNLSLQKVVFTGCYHRYITSMCSDYGGPINTKWDVFFDNVQISLDRKWSPPIWTLSKKYWFCIVRLPHLAQSKSHNGTDDQLTQLITHQNLEHWLQQCWLSLVGVFLPSAPQEQVMVVLTRPQIAPGVFAQKLSFTRDLVQTNIAPMLRNLNHSLTNLTSKQNAGSGFLRTPGQFFIRCWNQVSARFPAAADHIAVVVDQGAMHHHPVSRNGRASYALDHLLSEQLCADTKFWKLLENRLFTVGKIFGSDSRIWSVAAVLIWPVTSLQPRVVDDLAHVHPGAWLPPEDAWDKTLAVRRERSWAGEAPL